VKRKYRLTKSTDFKRVRRFGKSYAHPLMVLIRHPNDQGTSRFGISVGRSIGNAVQRNRTKRRIRETIRPLTPAITPGWDIILLARRPLATADYSTISSAVQGLLERAGLLNELHVN
jgi:ribonuclease P protein component